MALMIRSLYIKDLDVVLLHFKTGALSLDVCALSSLSNKNCFSIRIF